MAGNSSQRSKWRSRAGVKAALLALLICCVGAAGSSSAAPLPGQIIVHPGYPQWFGRHNGGPFFLCGPGDPEDFLYRGSRNADGTRNGDQMALIDKVKGTGANSFYMQAIRTFGDGWADHNPFIDSNFTQNIDQDIIDQWVTWLTEMDDNGIAIYFFFYDDAIRISTEIGWPLDGAGNLHPQEAYFIETLVNQLEHLENLVWVVSEEAEELGPDYVEHTEKIAEQIRATDDHDHPIGVLKLTGIDFFEFADNPVIDQFLIQDNTSPGATTLHNSLVDAWDLAAGRYSLNMAEAKNHGTESIARQKNWAIAMGGGYVMANGWNITDTPVTTLQDCGKLVSFMESTRFYEMAPHDELAFGGTDYVLSNPGVSYIAYAWNLSGDIGLQDMTAGVYDFTWFDADTGNSVEQPGVTVLAGDQTWSRPGGIGTELAVYIRTVDTLAPVIANTATDPAGPTVITDTITISGTATDGGSGDSGVAQVTVNGVAANNGSAVFGNIANWDLDIVLTPGVNTLTIVATDGSAAANQSSDALVVTYQPIPDGDLDGMPDSWEAANGTDPLVADDAVDDDLDDIPNGDEYKAGTDPQSAASAPEGANGVNYVLFRDHFDDALVDDRWYLRGMPPAGYALTESGTNLTAAVPLPAASCDVLSVESQAAVNSATTVYRASLQADGYGDAAIGLMGETDPANRIEIVLDNDTAPHAVIRSVENAVVTDTPIAAVTAPLQGVPVDLRIAKNGDQFAVFVDHVHVGTVTNASLDTSDLRPFINVTSCAGDGGAASVATDSVELLLDRDGDGAADTEEDGNADGVVGIDETDPLVADSDVDTVLDGFDNCPLVGNLDQTDTDSDLLGNECDADDDNDGVLDIYDQYPLDPAQSGIRGDIDGNGTIDVKDLLLLQQAMTNELALNSQQQYRADVHPVVLGDGELTIADLAELQGVLLGQ
ncbi:MAG: hypothetical protein ACN4GT_01500 [Gammaproteobacteria bacterium]